MQWFWSPQDKVWHCCHCFPILFVMKWWAQMPWYLFFKCWVLSQLFHSPFTFIKRLWSHHFMANRTRTSGRQWFLQWFLYGCESWTIKKAECQRMDDFRLWCWRRLLRVLWTARRSNRSIPKEINPEFSLEGLVEAESNTLATWDEELTHWKRLWHWERLKAKGEGGGRGWDG